MVGHQSRNFPRFDFHVLRSSGLRSYAFHRLRYNFHHGLPFSARKIFPGHRQFSWMNSYCFRTHLLRVPSLYSKFLTQRKARARTRMKKPVQFPERAIMFAADFGMKPERAILCFTSQLCPMFFRAESRRTGAAKRTVLWLPRFDHAPHESYDLNGSDEPLCRGPVDNSRNIREELHGQFPVLCGDCVAHLVGRLKGSD